jgi:type 1 fimbria pilin
MKRFQSLLASFVLVSALAATAAADGGTIHTGGAAVPQPKPTPTPQSIVADDGTVEGAEGMGEPTTLDLVVEAALDCLHAAFTLF